MTGCRRAVLIGTATYDQAAELPVLRAPAKDVKALTKILKERDECHFDDVVSLIDPPLQQLRVELNRAFVRCGPDDLLLIYYSGHGKLSPEGSLHLCSRDTLPELLPATSFGVPELRQYIDSHPIARVIIILDCCFSGAAQESLKGDIASMLRTNLGEGKGKYLLTSSSAMQPSLERAGDDFSVFTKLLIEGMETEAADVNGDGIITIEELYWYAKKRMEHEGLAQRPENFAWASPGDVVMWRSERIAETTRAAALKPEQPDWFANVRDLLERGQVIPFVGAGTYSGNVLNNFSLASALAARVGLKSQESLAATAEYCERFWKDRADLVSAFRELLEEQAAGVTPPSTHQLIADLTPPWVVVSATYDMVLEKRLAASGIPLVIVSHVLRSRDDMYNGVVVSRPGQKPEVCPADEFVFDDAKECVIYKILGSPFLHDNADPALALDALVLTETDHLTFLGRLEHERTKVPPSIKLHLERRKLLYLGYSLDIWHYRLVQHVFRSRKPQSFAVRQPTSQMEELMWQRLGTDVITWDPEEFAKTLLTVEASVA